MTALVVDVSHVFRTGLLIGLITGLAIGFVIGALIDAHGREP